MKRAPVLALSALLLAASCVEPRSVEEFVASPGPYVFELPVNDTLSLYDLSFYTRVEEAKYEANPAPTPALALDVTWFAPESADTTYYERVYMSPGDRHGIISRYRKGVRLPHEGGWTISVCLAEEPEGFRGIGLIVEKRKNGTR